MTFTNEMLHYGEGILAAGIAVFLFEMKGIKALEQIIVWT